MIAPAIHAEAVPNDATAMRWLFSDDLPAAGRLVRAPGELGEMIAQDGLIVRALAERRALWTWLSQPDWRIHGAEVTSAIFDAAQRYDLWQIDPDDDEVLAVIAADVIDRTLKQFIASHGGEIILIRADHAEVEVQLKGSCTRCPAAGLTVHGRIEHEIAQRIGKPVRVTTVDMPRRRWRGIHLT